ncbi:MAG TPA: hypothetical protein VFP50_13440, partial [Anaeromyxobacteraceae bacterium]|nr:hypothetical protein [Anaeromyxobacteraceae bacterium]
MPDLSAPSSFALWLEEALTGWILPVAALLLAAACWGAYALGWLPEGPAGVLIAIVFALTLGLLVVRAALAPSVDPAGRTLTLVAAALAVLACAVPAIASVLPGTPLAEAELAKVGDVMPLPAGVDGRVRLLVHAPLPQGGTPEVQFRLAGGVAPFEGQVERTISYARAGRSGRAAIARDHADVWVHGSLPAGATLKLDRLSGPVAGPLHVAVFPDYVPPVGHWLLALAVLALAAIAEARVGKGNVAALAGMAVAFGLLVGLNATPATAVGTSLGAVLLGGLGGALAGGLAALLAKLGPWRPAPETELREE